MTKHNDETNGEDPIYFYKHKEKACYYCIVSASSADIEDMDVGDRYYDEKLLAYYKAIAREKYDLVKASNYVNGSNRQYPLP